MKDRIKTLKRIPANKLIPHPKNHRLHPDSQKRALKGVLDEVGWADAVIVRETADGYQILDGHLRSELDNGKIPCLVVDVSDEEADLILASHDAIGAVAEINQSTLDELIRDISTNNPDIQELLAELATNTKVVLDEGQDFDTDCAKDVPQVTCPHCGEEFPL